MIEKIFVPFVKILEGEWSFLCADGEGELWSYPLRETTKIRASDILVCSSLRDARAVLAMVKRDILHRNSSIRYSTKIVYLPHPVDLSALRSVRTRARDYRRMFQ